MRIRSNKQLNEKENEKETRLLNQPQPDQLSDLRNQFKDKIREIDDTEITELLDYVVSLLPLCPGVDEREITKTMIEVIEAHLALAQPSMDKEKDLQSLIGALEKLSSQCEKIEQQYTPNSDRLGKALVIVGALFLVLGMASIALGIGLLFTGVGAIVCAPLIIGGFVGGMLGVMMAAKGLDIRAPRKLSAQMRLFHDKVQDKQGDSSDEDENQDMISPAYSPSKN